MGQERVVTFSNPLIHGPIRNKWKPDRTYDETGEEWRAYAECIGEDPNLFTVEDASKTGLVGAGNNREYNEAKFKIAYTFCERCQVKTACRIDSYARRDNEVTVRGGMNPYDVTPHPEDTPAVKASRPMDLEAGWTAYLAGRPMARVRRAAHCPESGPLPEWDEYLRAQLNTLVRVSWQPPGARTREGWLMFKRVRYAKTVRVVMPRGKTFERLTVPYDECRMSD